MVGAGWEVRVLVVAGWVEEGSAQGLEAQGSAAQGSGEATSAAD